MNTVTEIVVDRVQWTRTWQNFGQVCPLNSCQWVRSRWYFQLSGKNESGTMNTFGRKSITEPIKWFCLYKSENDKKKDRKIVQCQKVVVYRSLRNNNRYTNKHYINNLSINNRYINNRYINSSTDNRCLNGIFN